MMASGGGLPVPKTGNAVTQISGVLDGDKLSSATAWGRIAQIGARLAADGQRVLELEMHQQQARHVAETEIEDADTLAKLRDKHAFNPQGFETEARGYLDGKVSEAPGWDAARRKKYIGGRMEATLGTILSETRARDTRLAGEALDARRQRAEIEVTSLAQGGKIGTPDYAAAVATYNGVLDTAVSTNLMTREKADLLVDDLVGRATGEAAAREGVAIYQEKGYEAAVDHLQKNIRDNESLTLKGDGRRKAFNRGLEAINLQKRVDREDRVGIVQDAQDLLARIKSNQPVDPGTLNDTLNAAKRVGAYSAYRDLFVEDSVQKLTAPYRSGAVRPADFARVIGAARSGNFSGLKPEEMPVAAQAVTQTATNLGIAPRDLAAAISYETGGSFDPNKRGGKNNNHLGLIQFGAEERAKYGVREGMTFPEQMRAVEGYLRDRGLKPGMGVAELYSIINAGSLDASGQPRYNLSDGNGTVRDHIGRIQRDHHGVADKFLTGQGGQDGDVPGLPGVPFAGQIVKRAQAEFSTQMRKDWPDLQKQIAAGKEIDTDDFQAVRMAAALSGDANWIKQVEDTASALKIGLATRDMTATQRQAYLDQVRANFDDGIHKIVKAQFDRQQEMLKDDPVGFAIERGRGAPMPLVLADSNALRAGLNERARIAQTVSQDQGVPLSVALRPAEIGALQAALAGADLKGKARIYSDLTAALPEDQRALVLGKLGKTGSAAMVEAFAGAMYGASPEVAESIMRGQRALATDERFDPTKGKNKDTFNEVLDKAMPATAFSLAARTSEGGAFATFRSAIVARYADLSAQAGDTAGALNEDRMKKAVDDVTGGVVTHNGRSLIAPRRGMGQKDFDSVVHSLGDGDFAGVTTLAGEPVSAKYVRDNAKLESIGSGRYLVQLGNDPLRPIYAFSGANTEAPAPFILDLRNKQPVTSAPTKIMREFQPYPRG